MNADDDDAEDVDENYVNVKEVELLLRFMVFRSVPFWPITFHCHLSLLLLFSELRNASSNYCVRICFMTVTILKKIRNELHYIDLLVVPFA